MHKQTVMLIVGALTLLTAQPAAALTSQEACSDILQNGTFQTARYRQNDYFQQIIYSRFISSTYESSQTDTAAGFGIPLGEAVMGSGSYSRGEYDARKAQIQSTFLNVVQQSREVDVALTSGDTAVIDAWKQCMIKRGGGVSMRFEAASATDAFCNHRFLFCAQHDRKNAVQHRYTSRRHRDIRSRMPQKGYRYTSRRVMLCHANYAECQRDWLSALNTTSGQSVAYLPPRLTRKIVTKAYPFATNCEASTLGESPSADVLTRCADRLWSHARREVGDISPQNTISVPAKELAEGWAL